MKATSTAAKQRREHLARQLESTIVLIESGRVTIRGQGASKRATLERLRGKLAELRR